MFKRILIAGGVAAALIVGAPWSALAARAAAALPVDVWPPAGCEWRSLPPDPASFLFCRTREGDMVPARAPATLGPGSADAAKAGDVAAMRSLGELYLFGPAAVRNAQLATPLLKAAAQKGDAIAMADLGAMSAAGVGVVKDPSAAADWFARAAASEDPQALFAVALRYEHGIQLEVDSTKALALLRRAVDHGSDPARVELARLEAAGQAPPLSDADAVALLKAGADQGEPESMAALGLRYLDGVGVPKDESEGVRLLRKSADQGCACGALGLGQAYARGLGVSRSDAAAFGLYQRAAYRGLPRGMTLLGAAYADGKGVARDDALALAWLRAAGAARDPEAMALLGRLAARGGNPALKWAHTPSADDISAAYPIEAAIERIPGEVIYHCTLSADLRPTACRAIAEAPPGHGFAEAGLGLTAALQLNSGLAPGSDINLPIRFALPGPLASRPIADRCAAYSLAELKVRSFAGLPEWRTRYWPALSRHYAEAAGEGDPPDRLGALVNEESQKLAAGTSLFAEHLNCGF